MLNGSGNLCFENSLILLEVYEEDLIFKSEAHFASDLNFDRKEFVHVWVYTHKGVCVCVCAGCDGKVVFISKQWKQSA